MNHKLSQEGRLRIEKRELQRRLDAYEAAATVLPLALMEGVSALAHIAINGLRRPEDLGGTITGLKASSTGSRLPNPAYREFERTLQRLEREAARLDALLERYDPAVAGEGDGTSQSIGAA